MWDSVLLENGVVLRAWRAAGRGFGGGAGGLWTGPCGPGAGGASTAPTPEAGESPGVPGRRSLTVAARRWSAVGCGAVGIVRPSYYYLYGKYPFPFRFSSPDWTNFFNLALSAHLSRPFRLFRASL